VLVGGKHKVSAVGLFCFERFASRIGPCDELSYPTRLPDRQWLKSVTVVVQLESRGFALREETPDFSHCG